MMKDAKQEQHPGLTLTAKEKQIHDQGLVTVLRQIHDELDEAVLEAYGWQDCSGDHRSPRMAGSDKEDSRRPVIAATLHPLRSDCGLVGGRISHPGDFRGNAAVDGSGETPGAGGDGGGRVVVGNGG